MGIALLFVIAITVFVFVMKLPKTPKLVSVGMILFVIVASICDMTPLLLDLSEDAPITYTGAFTVEEAIQYKDGERKAVLTFADYEHKRFVVKDDDELEPDTYYGTIIYAEHSKMVLDWSGSAVE
ncbi:MAG: hypothetical protein IJY42_03910 [Clostridia bacterium]|nr:hypothetical protein [Clostridia bacterium]